MRKGLILFACAMFMAAALRAAAVKDTAPEFALKNFHGDKIALSDLKGKVVFVNFWASWCGPCAQELPKLSQLAEDYKKENFSLVAINVDPDQIAAQKFLGTLPIPPSPMETVWDPDSKIVSAYDPQTMPSSFVIDAQGVIRYVHAGFTGGDTIKWRQEIDSILVKKAPVETPAP